MSATTLRWRALPACQRLNQKRKRLVRATFDCTAVGVSSLVLGLQAIYVTANNVHMLFPTAHVYRCVQCAPVRPRALTVHLYAEMPSHTNTRTHRAVFYHRFSSFSCTTRPMRGAIVGTCALKPKACAPKCALSLSLFSFSYKHWPPRTGCPLPSTGVKHTHTHTPTHRHTHPTAIHDRARATSTEAT